jgi:hypothetical protein
VAEGEYPNEPGFAIDFIDQAKPSPVVFSQAGQFAETWLAGEWV